MPVLRIIGGIALGLVAGGIVVMLVQLLAFFVYPIPEGFDAQDPAQLELRIENAPPLAKAIIWIAWTLGAFLGTLITTLVAGRGYHWWGLAIGLAITGGAVSVLLQFPNQGAAMWILGLTLPIIASFLVCRGTGRKATAAA